ncbi:MAG: ABC-F family ATP-binding cassette domain-containing protein, partial [Polyangiales bacterium]
MLHAHRLSKAYGPQCLLTEVDFTVRAGERVGLVGHNGSGKSTLGKIVAGIETADAGHVQLQRGATVAYLEQDPRFEAALSVRAAACAGLGPWSAAKARFEAASQALDAACEKQMPALLREQSEAAQAVERLGGWHREHEVEAMLTQLGVSGHDRPVTELSGGERRRVALARLLTAAPDIAVLDEPTNHLDIDAVAWLESHLQQHWRGALILITHDRYLLDRVVERTVELDRGQLYSYAGGWQAYLQAKAERQAQAARTEANRQNFLRRELVWLRASPKARTRKNKARVERAEAAQAARPQAAEPKLQLRAQSGPRLGKTLLEMHAAQVGIAGRTLLQDVDFILQEGDRIGIIGPNGAGKPTL